MLETQLEATRPISSHVCTRNTNANVFSKPAPAGYATEIADTVREIDLEAWHRLCPSGTDPFMNPGLLYAAETSMSANAACWYILFRNSERRPVAAATISTYVMDSTVLATGVSAKIAGLVSRIVPSLTRIKILFLGMPFSAGQSHVRFAPEADRRLIVKQLSELLEAKAKETKSEIIVAKEFQESELEWASALEEYGFRRADSLPMNYMPTHYDSFDQYLADVRSKKRNELKGIAKKLRDANLSLVVCRGDEAAARFTDRAHKLYENVLFRSQTPAEYLPKEFFIEFAKQLQDAAKFLYVYEGERLLGFGCCLQSEAVFAPMYAGIDYERNRELGLYLNLLFLSVNEGLKNNSPELWVGANADEIKHNKLRTYQEPRYLYVRGGWWLATLLLKGAFKMFFPSHELLYPREQVPPVRKAA